MYPSRFDRGTRRIALCGVTTLSAVVLLFSYRTSTSSGLPDGADTATNRASGTDSTGTESSAAAAVGVQPSPATGPTGAPTARAVAGAGWSGTVTGPAVRVRWGQVRVRARLAAGRITAVDVLQVPDDNSGDKRINGRAVPILVRETLAAQTSRIDMVSGATMTSTGYVRSLQAALDRLGTA